METRLALLENESKHWEQWKSEVKEDLASIGKAIHNLNEWKIKVIAWGTIGGVVAAAAFQFILKVWAG